LRKYSLVLYFHSDEKVFFYWINNMLNNADLKKATKQKSVNAVKTKGVE